MTAAGPEKEETISPEPAPQALPLREETFLAHYPRNLKIAATIILMVLLIAPWFFFGHHLVVTPGKEKRTESAAPQVAEPEITTVDSGAQVPNPPVLSAPSPVLNSQDDRSIKMAPAPDSGLTEDTAEGSLPRIGMDGREPWQVYARPFNAADTRPRIAIIIADLGLSRVITDAAIDQLPANVTLAFNGQSKVAGAWCARARQDGHETLLMVPMEPFDYPRSDPGPGTLLTTLPNADNIERLLLILREASGYVGITTLTGSRFTTDPQKLGAIMDILKKRGLLVVDAHIAPHSAVADMAIGDNVPVAIVTEQLDRSLTSDAIDAAFDRLEKTARRTGHAVGIASATPLLLDKLQNWLKELPARGIALAPVSAVTK